MRIFVRLLIVAAVLWLKGRFGSVLATNANESKKTPSSTEMTYAPTTETRTSYAARIGSTYNFHFGQDHPSTPGNAKVEGDEFIQPGAFPSATYCGRCHQEAYAEWRQALHSNSFRTPFYRTSVNILIHTKGIEFSRHCDSCHNPIAVLSGGLTQESQVNRNFDRDGLTCMTCHSIQKLQSTSGNGGYEMGVPAVMVDEKGKRIPGMVPDAEILAHLDRHSKAVMQDIYRQPEFCASCHKANLPVSLNDYKFVRAFTTYDEWQQSKFSQRNPLTFYPGDFMTCQSCHMARGDHALPEPGAKSGGFASHRWLAGNTAVPFYYGFNTQLQKTVAFLQSGNFLNVDIFALKKLNDNALIAAVRAFHQVADMRPDYADAYTNVALTEIQWEKYNSASQSIQRALALAPGNARALYYEALIDRRMGKADDAMAELQKVVAQYPQSRDARRELGISFYQKHEYDEAMEQFEALQKIDPDDLAAHYNLAILYRRIGRKQESAEQQAMFASKKFDPGAPTFALNFLRTRPELSEESIPWHLHTDLPYKEAASHAQGGTPSYGGGQYGGGHP